MQSPTNVLLCYHNVYPWNITVGDKPCSTWHFKNLPFYIINCFGVDLLCLSTLVCYLATLVGLYMSYKVVYLAYRVNTCRYIYRYFNFQIYLNGINCQSTLIPLRCMLYKRYPTGTQVSEHYIGTIVWARANFWKQTAPPPLHCLDYGKHLLRSMLTSLLAGLHHHAFMYVRSQDKMCGSSFKVFRKAFFQSQNY